MTDRSANIDFALAACCSFALVAVLSAAFREEPKTSSSAKGAAIGRLSFEENEVRRRAEGTLAWQTLHLSEPLFNRDAVFVGSRSRAVIELEDGATIDVAEGALVVVHRPERTEVEAAPISVEIVRGVADAHAGRGGLKVRSGETEIAATPGSMVRVQTDRRRGPRIDVTAGQAVVAAKGQPSVAVPAGSRATVDRDSGASTREQLAVDLVNPTPGQTVYGTEESFELQLEWVAPPGSSSCDVELSEDPHFERIEARSTGKASARVVAPKPGTWSWRVRCDSAQGLLASEDRLLHLVRDVPPVPLHPAPGAVLLASAEAPMALSWTEVEGSNGYELQLLQEGRPPQLETPWSPVFRPEQPLAQGEWCYRVRAQPSGRETPWSTPACFRITGDDVLPAPELLQPTRETLKKDGERRGAVDYLWLLVGGVAHADTAQSAIVLRWRSIAGADSYILEIAEDPGFERKVLEKRVRDTWFKWPTVLRRDYYWRVRAVDPQGREGRMSEVVRLESEIVPITLHAPAASATIEFAERRLTVPLRWSGPKVARSYRVEVATDSSFSQVLFARELAGTEASFEPELAGEFHWRVSAKDLEGQKLAPSEPSRFKVVSPAPVAASQRQRLMPGQVTLSWSTRPVKAYELQVASDAGFKRVEVRRAVRGATTARIPIDEPGRYHWRVRGIEPETAWSEAERLLVRPETPTALAPLTGATLTGAAAESGVELRWSEGLNARGYEVELRRGEEVIAREASTPFLRIDVASTAQLSWRVRAVHRSGVESEWSQQQTFAVARTPTVAVITAPAKPEVPASSSAVVPTPPTAAATPTTGYVGLAFGIFHNLGRLQSPRAALELGWRPERFGRRFGAAISVGYYRGSVEAASEGLSTTATLDAIPITVTASWVIPTRAVDLVLSFGPSWSLAHTAVTVEPGDRFQMTHSGFGLTALAGVERRFGPGAAFAEAGWLQSPAVDGLIVARPSGLSIQAGYRLGAW